VTAYLLHFCHNSHYPKERKTGFEFKTVLYACICMVPEALMSWRHQISHLFLMLKRAVNFTASVHSETCMNSFGWVEDSVIHYYDMRKSFISSHLQVLHLKELTVKAQHQELLHVGPQYMLASLRQEYWNPGGRQKFGHHCTYSYRTLKNRKLRVRN
jgi:hypothetical protein